MACSGQWPDTQDFTLYATGGQPLRSAVEAEETAYLSMVAEKEMRPQVDMTRVARPGATPEHRPDIKQCLVPSVLHVVGVYAVH